MNRIKINTMRRSIFRSFLSFTKQKQLLAIPTPKGKVMMILEPLIFLTLFFGIFCFLMIAAIGLVPRFHMKSLAKIMADGKTVEAEIYPTHIDIGKEEGAWTVELDGKAEIAEFDGIIMIYDGDRSFAVPERVIEPEVYNEIKAILLSGTMPEEN